MLFGLSESNKCVFCFQIMVFLADCLCPSKRHRPQQYPYSSKCDIVSKPLNFVLNEPFYTSLCDKMDT